MVVAQGIDNKIFVMYKAFLVKLLIILIDFSSKTHVNLLISIETFVKYLKFFDIFFLYSTIMLTE